MATRIIKKSLITKQDLAMGKGKIVQVRNGINYNLDKLDLVSNISSQADLDGLIGDYDGEKLSMTGFHPNSDVGGGVWYWKADEPKANHDGGTKRSPTVPFTGATLANFLDGVGEADVGGNGCWVKQMPAYVVLEDFGAKGVLLDDATPALWAAKAYASTVAPRILITSHGSKHYRLTQPFEFGSVLMDMQRSFFYADFDGQVAFTMNEGNPSVKNLWLRPTPAYESPSDVANPTHDGLSHGLAVGTRADVFDVYVRNFKGDGVRLEPVANANNLQFSCRSWYNGGYGFRFLRGTRDDLSISFLDLRPFGNGYSGFYADDDSFCRQNYGYIDSESNNRLGLPTPMGQRPDVYFGDSSNGNDFIVYSEKGANATHDLYVSEVANRNSLKSMRRNNDFIAGSNVSINGNRVHKRGADNQVGLELFNETGGYTDPDRYLDFLLSVSSGTYGGLRGRGAGVWLRSPNGQSNLIGVDNVGATVGSQRLNVGSLDLTTSVSSGAISIITGLATSKLITGELIITARSGGNVGRLRQILSFTCYNGAVAYDTVSNINSHTDTWSTRVLEVVGGDLVLSLSYQSGNLGGLYKVDVEYSYKDHR